MIKPIARLRALMLLACLPLISGCWDNNEIDELALVMASGLDLTQDGELEGTFQIALPASTPIGSMQGGKRKPVLVVSAKGRDALDVRNRIQQQLSRKIFLGHRAVIVIGENFARHGLHQGLDVLLRAPDSRYSCYFVTSFGSTAKEVLSSPYELELIPAAGLNKIEHARYGVAVKIDEFLNEFVAPGKDPVTGAIRLTKTDGKRTFILDKAAVYRDSRLVGYLSGQELKMYRVLRHHHRGNLFSVQGEPNTEESKGRISMEFMRVKTLIRTQLVNGRPEATIRFRGVGRIISNDTQLDLSKNDLLAKVADRYREDTKKTMERLFARSQKEYRSDVLGIGRELHIQHPEAWKTLKKDWTAVYSEMPIRLEVEVELERFGRTLAPPYAKE